MLLLRDAIERGEPLRTVRVADEGDRERPGSITKYAMRWRGRPLEREAAVRPETLPVVVCGRQ